MVSSNRKMLSPGGTIKAIINCGEGHGFYVLSEFLVSKIIISFGYWVLGVG